MNDFSENSHVPVIQRAIVQSDYGPCERVLSLSTSYPVTPPSPTQLLIKVGAASLNPIDWQMIEGNRRLIARRDFPFVPLFDLAGVVVTAGRDVTRFKVGDRVHADNQRDGGGASEFVNVDESLANLIPGSLSFVEAAAIPLAAQTALLALEKGGVEQGTRVCIIGASGGVGTFAVQIAKALGANRIVGVCSGRNSACVASLGADQTVDYTQTNISDALGVRSMDVVLDCVGGREQWLHARHVLARGGKFVTISRDEDEKLTVRSALAMIATIVFRQVLSRWGERISYIPVFLDASAELLDRVDKLVETGKLKVNLANTYSLSVKGLIDAIKENKKRRTIGKTVFTMEVSASDRHSRASRE